MDLPPSGSLAIAPMTVSKSPDPYTNEKCTTSPPPLLILSAEPMLYHREEVIGFLDEAGPRLTLRTTFTKSTSDIYKIIVKLSKELP
jgi:hypothetical protein